MLQPDRARRVADAFGLGSEAVLVGPVATGRLGRIWRLTTDRGRYAVKDSHLPIDAADVARDAAYQDLVRAHGVAMPAVVRTPAGEALANVDGPVRAYAWVDLLPSTRRLDPVAVGRLLARIHRVAVPTTEPVDGWYVEPIGAAAWEDLVGRLAAAGAPFAHRLAALLPEVLAAEALLVPPTDVQLCHRDLWADNLLRTGDGELVVLDWENAGPADPSQELALALVEFGCGEPGRMRALHEAYVEAGGPGRLTGPHNLTMLIAQTGHIARTGCERWLAARDDEARTDNAAWVAEYLDEPPTTGVVEVVLRAVGA
jgi:aminoglycoside phosphotransferase (APT) family kinase protein